MVNQLKNRKVSLSENEKELITSTIAELGEKLPVYLKLCREDNQLSKQEYLVLIRDLEEFHSLFVSTKRDLPYFFIPSFLESFQILQLKANRSTKPSAPGIRLVLDRIIKRFQKVDDRLKAELLAE